jgi:hypothetical protein
VSILRHDWGKLEALLEVPEDADAHAVLGWLRSRYPGLPYTLAGFSFGSRVVLNLGCTLANRDPVGVLADCAVPKVFMQSTHDEYGPPPEMEAFHVQVSEPKWPIWAESRIISSRPVWTSWKGRWQRSVEIDPALQRC